MTVLVSDYDASWAEQFNTLRTRYVNCLAAAGVSVVAIEHVGSTAVPGLAAKPVIDIDIVVTTSDVAPASAALVGLGFRPLGELGIPLRWPFAAPDDFACTNTYVTESGSLALRNHLALRDTLRANAALRDEYGAVKKAAGATALGICEYGNRKNDMVQRILSAAGLTADELSSIAGNQVPGPEVLAWSDEPLILPVCHGRQGHLPAHVLGNSSLRLGDLALRDAFDRGLCPQTHQQVHQRLFLCRVRDWHGVQVYRHEPVVEDDRIRLPQPKGHANDFHDASAMPVLCSPAPEEG